MTRRLSLLQPPVLRDPGRSQSAAARATTTRTGISAAAQSGDHPSRRAYLADERTLLGWWRTGLAAAAVAVAVGGLLPKLGGVPRDRCVALGIGYGLLAFVFVIGGALRNQFSRKAFKRKTFAVLSERGVWVITLYTALLIILTMVALL